MTVSCPVPRVSPAYLLPVFGWLGVLLGATGAAGQEACEAAAAMPALRIQDIAPEEVVPVAPKEEPLAWYLLLAGVNVYPRLESERLIDRYFDPIMEFLAPGQEDVFTIGDLRDAGMLWPPHFGLGRNLSSKLSLFFQTGFSIGKVRTEQTHTSILLLPLHTDFEIQRGAGYFGVGLDYYPLGTVELRERKGFRDRFRGIRPCLGGRFTYTYAIYDAKVKVGLEPFPNLDIKLSDRFLLPSVELNVGLDFPLNETNVLFMNAGYAFFWDEQQDFAGPAFTLGWKTFFR